MPVDGSDVESDNRCDLPPASSLGDEQDFRLLGRLEVDADGVDLTPVRPKQRALLALLLLQAGEVLTIDELIEGLWGPRPPETAQTALHGHISALRKRLRAERIETQPPGYRLRLAAGDELDAHRFERVVAAARTDGPSARSRKLREALVASRSAFDAPESRKRREQTSRDGDDQVRIPVGGTGASATTLAGATG